MSTTDTIAIAELAEVNPKVDLRRLREDTPVSFIPMSDVTEGGRWVNRQERIFDDVRFGYTAFAEDDVLFAKITPCMENGKGTHAVGLRNGVGFGSTEFHVLRARGANSARFVYHWMQASATRTRAIAYMGGSAGQQRVQSDFFTNFRVPRLAPDEQSCVAAVLDTIDEAITQAEAVIAKLRQVRTGLFQSLLTCGLDHNGQLRTPAAQPQQFKDSLVGLIPKAWEELTLRACLFAPPQNGIYKPPREIGRGALLIGQTSITLDRSIDLALARRAEATEEECARYGLRAGDLLISRVFATLDGVGQPALVPSLPEDAVYESNMMRLRPRLEIISPTILFHWLRMPRVRSFLISRANLSNQASVNQEALNSLPVFAPPPDEQEAIVAAISSYDENCRIQNEELAKLRAFKSGLMTDLLTGRVPVPKSIGGSP